jgi:ABC-type sugar transport system ATPase subunit
MSVLKNGHIGIRSSFAMTIRRRRQKPVQQCSIRSNDRAPAEAKKGRNSATEGQSFCSFKNIEVQPWRKTSGGERQAVAIARAMHFDSDLIILDEPTNNLGVAETQGVLRFVRNARDSGHSCILIAHNIHHAFQVVDRIVVMRRGHIVADDIAPKTTSVAEVENVITGEISGLAH